MGTVPACEPKLIAFWELEPPSSTGTEVRPPGTDELWVVTIDGRAVVQTTDRQVAMDAWYAAARRGENPRAFRPVAEPAVRHPRRGRFRVGADAAGFAG